MLPVAGEFFESDEPFDGNFMLIYVCLVEILATPLLLEFVHIDG